MHPLVSIHGQGHGHSPAHKQPPWLRGRKGSSPNGKGWFAPDTLWDEQPEERSELPVALTALLAHVHHKDREAALSSGAGGGVGHGSPGWLHHLLVPVM